MVMIFGLSIVADQNGNISDQLYYEAYCKTTDSNGNPLDPVLGSSLPPLFLGAYGIRYDRKTELSYMRFRWYEQSKMCFISSDKLLQNNRYSYVYTNPLSFVDPLGLFIFYTGTDADQLRLNGIMYFIKTNGPFEVRNGIFQILYHDGIYNFQDLNRVVVAWKI